MPPWDLLLASGQGFAVSVVKTKHRIWSHFAVASLLPQSKQSSSYSDRDTTEEESESLDDMDFLSRQRKLQAEAKMALAMAKPMAKMQVEVEKQNRKKSPVADLVSGAGGDPGVSNPCLWWPWLTWVALGAEGVLGAGRS